MPSSAPQIDSKKRTVITIDPVTRIEGHLRLEAVVDGGEVKDARCCGTLFRGFENILVGRHPFDACRITQRVCGVCPAAHGSASSFCLDEAVGAAGRIPPNGRLVRNLLLGSNYIQSHVLHFFTLAALDYVDVTALADYEGGESALKAVRAFIDRGALAPFFPRYEGDYRCDKQTNVDLVRAYLQALHARRTAHEMLCVFGGKMPHNVGLVPGGATCEVTADRIATFMGKLREIREFIDDVYVPTILTVAQGYGDYFEIGVGCRRFLAYGAFDLDGDSTDPVKRSRLLPAGLVDADGRLAGVDAARITEDVAGSRYTDDCAAHPSAGKTTAEPEKGGAYSWLKSPRYDGAVTEVGPLARGMVAYAAGDERFGPELDAAMSAAGIGPEKLPSVLGRHLARALETRIVAGAMMDWLGELRPGEPVAVEVAVPDEGAGVGLTGAPRGALGHWIQIKDKVIERYQLVVPTTWNVSPRDAQGQPGPVEQALIGTKINDPDNPFEIVRIIRSFDPCMACSVHVMDAAGTERGAYRIA